jgi:Bacterial PH domain
MHPTLDCSQGMRAIGSEIASIFRGWRTEACLTSWLCYSVSSAEEIMPVPLENQTATPNLETGPFMTNNLIAAAGAAPEAIAGSSSKPEDSSLPSAGVSSGLEDEQTLWEGSYSAKNFLGRAIFGALFVLGWAALALTTWGFGYSNLAFLTYATGGAVLLYCCFTAFKYVRARRNHYYRLTSRRLFLTTGIFQRRVDQVELVRVKDLFMRQTLLGSWLDLGTVIVLSSEQTLPKAVLLGIEEPHRVRDLIWHHTRLEREHRTTEVNQI